VLVVDDDREFLVTTQLLLGAESYVVACAQDGPSALESLSKVGSDVALVAASLLVGDGSALFSQMRAIAPQLQIVILSGGTSEQPSRQFLRECRIQGLCDKSEGPERLLLWTDVAAKAARSLRQLQRSRCDLDAVLVATTHFHKLAEKSALYTEILERTSTLARAAGAILALFPDALGEDGDLLVEEVTGASARVVAGTGSLQQARDWTRVLAQGGLSPVRRSMNTKTTQVEVPWVSLPLRVGDHILGFLAMKVDAPPEMELELFDVLAHQASVAIQNAHYYEMAALDPLTGVHARRFFDVWTRREVRAALRTGQPLGVLLIDMDGLKAINDQGGHRVGDTAIGAVGRVLREATREHDLAARLGGDEFAMLMPNTDLDGVTAVARRILELLGAKTVLIAGQSSPLSVSIGAAVLQSRGPCPASVGRGLSAEFFEDLVERLVRRADDALYHSKRTGRGRVSRSEPLEIPWSSTERPPAHSSEELA
jgi:diguanylate cyclase (GGDEF)-like protein